MKILVINPPRYKGLPVTRTDRLEYVDAGEVFPPLTLLYTATLLEQQGHDVKFVDANGFDLSVKYVRDVAKRFQPDLTITRTAFDIHIEDLGILKAVKEVSHSITTTRCKIISDVPTILKDVFRKTELDYFFMQEEEAIVLDFVENLEKGFPHRTRGIAYREDGSVKTTQAAPYADLNKLPFPAYHLLPSIKCYGTSSQPPVYTLVESSRGCVYNCSFCAGHVFYRARNPSNVIDELCRLKSDYDLDRFYFYDDSFGLNRRQAIEICKQMVRERLDLEWTCGMRVDSVDDELLDWMSKAGCTMIAFGVESGSQEILDRCNKQATLSQAEMAFMLARKHHILSYCMIVLGLPGETIETIRQTVRWINKSNVDYCQYCIAIPFPNTEFFKKYHEMGYITTYDWSQYSPTGTKPVISSPALDSKQLEQMRYWAYQRFIFRPRYLIRMVRPLDMAWNLRGLKFVMNHLRQIFLRSPLR